MIDLTSLGRITSNFGNRNSPTAGASSNHKGIDIVLNDKNIPAVTSGTVVANAYSSARGYYISIKDSNGYTQTYQHLASKPILTVGSTVKEGDIIAKEGSTGVSTGSHLHYEVKDKTGTYINPLDFLKGATGSPNYETVLTSNSNDSGGLFNWKNTAVKIGKNITVVVFIIVLIIIMYLTFTNAMGMKLF